jgi:hypothetical protein
MPKLSDEALQLQILRELTFLAMENICTYALKNSESV